MTIDKTLDKMDDLLNEGVAMPLTGRRLIDVEKMQDLIDDLRMNLPQEIKDAKAVVSERNEILEQAEAQAEELWLTHYSPSMPDPAEFAGEAAGFANTVVTADGTMKTIKFRDE